MADLVYAAVDGAVYAYALPPSQLPLSRITLLLQLVTTLVNFINAMFQFYHRDHLHRCRLEL
jgi:hypothetical protein